MKLTEGQIEFSCDFTEADFSEWTAEQGSRVKNVVWLGPKSKNGYEYLPEAMKAAVHQFENVPLYLNHPGLFQGREVQSLAGKGVNARFEDGKIKGDAVLLPDAQGKKFKDIAELMPSVAGMSQMAEGKKRTEGGKTVVHEITKVHSVDLVSSPATTKSMFEDTKGKTERKHAMELTEATIHDVKGKLPAVAEALIAEGAASRDAEVLKLTTEKEALDAKIAENEAAVAKAELGTQVDKMLADSDLEKDQITDVFRNSLLLAENDEARTAMIEDRIEVGKTKGVHSSGTPGDDKGRMDIKEATALLQS